MTYEEREAKLKALLTDEFLNTLVEAAKTEGPFLDYHEVQDFVKSCFTIAGKPCPDLTPYE